VPYIGMSSCWAYQLYRVISYVLLRCYQQQINVTMQNHHNLIYREEEKEMSPTLKYFGVGAISWSPTL
ncbi:hypothetical protein J3R30DRAFT_3280025, partial [Lentinula aciculospora]